MTHFRGSTFAAVTCMSIVLYGQVARGEELLLKFDGKVTRILGYLDERDKTKFHTCDGKTLEVKPEDVTSTGQKCPPKDESTGGGEDCVHVPRGHRNIKLAHGKPCRD